jgi:hypothetical protein
MNKEEIDLIYKEEIFDKIKSDSMLKHMISDTKPLILNAFKEIAWESWKQMCLRNYLLWDSREERVIFEDWYERGIG